MDKKIITVLALLGAALIVISVFAFINNEFEMAAADLTFGIIFLIGAFILLKKLKK